MINVALVEAMSQAGWSYDEASGGFTIAVALPFAADADASQDLWVSWQQAADMLAAAEKGREVAAVEVEPTSRNVAELLNGSANDP